jgi:hypothetical protein
MELLRQKRIAQIDHTEPQSVVAALDGLYHDEHIDVAIRCGIFKSAYVIQHSHHELLPEWQEFDMVVWPTEIDIHSATESDLINYYDKVLEDDFLERQLQMLPSDFSLEANNYILDIDLDVFKTKRSLKPKSCEILKKMVDNSVGVTIAMESEWVQRLSKEDDLTAIYMLEQLVDLLED